MSSFSASASERFKSSSEKSPAGSGVSGSAGVSVFSEPLNVPKKSESRPSSPSPSPVSSAEGSAGPSPVSWLPPSISSRPAKPERVSSFPASAPERFKSSSEKSPAGSGISGSAGVSPLSALSIEPKKSESRPSSPSPSPVSSAEGSAGPSAPSWLPPSISSRPARPARVSSFSAGASERFKSSSEKSPAGSGVSDSAGVSAFSEPLNVPKKSESRPSSPSPSLVSSAEGSAGLSVLSSLPPNISSRPASPARVSSFSAGVPEEEFRRSSKEVSSVPEPESSCPEGVSPPFSNAEKSGSSCESEPNAPNSFRKSSKEGELSDLPESSLFPFSEEESLSKPSCSKGSFSKSSLSEYDTCTSARRQTAKFCRQKLSNLSNLTKIPPITHYLVLYRKRELFSSNQKSKCLKLFPNLKKYNDSAVFAGENADSQSKSLPATGGIKSGQERRAVCRAGRIRSETEETGPSPPSSLLQRKIGNFSKTIGNRRPRSGNRQDWGL